MQQMENEKEKQKEVKAPLAKNFNPKPKKKIEQSTYTDRSALLISTSQDKILSPKTHYNFIPRSNSQQKMTCENNKSHIGNCSEINYTNYNNNGSHNTTTTYAYSSAEGYWQRREMEKKRKMDQIRDMNYQKEQNAMRDRPNISKNSQIIASHLRSKSKEQVFDRLSSGVDMRKKNEDIKRIEMRTRENRQPLINQSSQRLQRTIDDLYQWKVQIERKRLENQTLTNCSFDPTPIINCESEVILKQRKPDYLRKRVEDRLIEQGEITKIKKEEKKEHYHERIMGSNEDKKCYMTTCPSKRPVDHVTHQTYSHSNGKAQVKANVNINEKKYIQKNTNRKSNINTNVNSIQNSDSSKYNNNTSNNDYYNNSNAKRSISGKLRYSNEPNAIYDSYNQFNNKQQSKPIASNNVSNQNTKPNYNTKANNNNNTLVRDNANLSYDIGSKDTLPHQQLQQQPSLLIKANTNNASGNENNLMEIRKHLNDYYEQKAQIVNKSFSYKNNPNTNANQRNMTQGASVNTIQNVNQSQGIINPNAQMVQSNVNVNNNSNGHTQIKNQLQKHFPSNQSKELEEDKIINQIPQNEPQVKYQPVLFQEEEQWIPCGKGEQQSQPQFQSQQQQQFNYDNNYINHHIDVNHNQYQQKQNDYSNINQTNQCYLNQNRKNLQDHQFYSSQGNSPLKQSTQNIQTNDQLQKYNFNHDIFNRYSQEPNHDKANPIQKHTEPTQPKHPRQYFTLTPEMESNIPSSRYEESLPQFNESNIPSASKYGDENPLSKYRDETNKRLQDLEQMQQFANNLRQSNEITQGKKIVPNSCNNHIPQSQISNAKLEKGNYCYDSYANQVNNEDMTYLNDRLKLNEQSKNFLYEKMNQISAYPSNMAQQSNERDNANNSNATFAYYQNTNLNSNINNNFDFQRRKL